MTPGEGGGLTRHNSMPNAGAMHGLSRKTSVCEAGERKDAKSLSTVGAFKWGLMKHLLNEGILVYVLRWTVSRVCAAALLAGCSVCAEPRT
jgi:hypothetical protein